MLTLVAHPSSKTVARKGGCRSPTRLEIRGRLIGSTGPGGRLFFLWKLGVGVIYSGMSFILLARLGNGGRLFGGVVYSAG